MSRRILMILFSGSLLCGGCGTSHSGQFYASRMESYVRTSEAEARGSVAIAHTLKQQNDEFEDRVIAGRAAASEAEVQAQRCQSRGAALLGKGATHPAKHGEEKPRRKTQAAEGAPVEPPAAEQSKESRE